MTESVIVAQKCATLQGETSRAGYPCWLIRLAGCSLRCRFCDTSWAQNPEGAETAIALLVAEAVNAGLHHVLVTGGEPLEQKHTLELLRQLADAGLRTVLETSGACSTAEVDPRVLTVLDVKCPGSGMTDRMLWSNLTHLKSHDEVKFVLTHREDYEFALETIRRHDIIPRAAVLLSPLSGQLDPRELAQWMLADKLSARLQIQLHRLAWPNLE